MQLKCVCWPFDCDIYTKEKHIYCEAICSLLYSLLRMVCNNWSDWFIIANSFAVEKLAAVPSYTPATAQLMVDSFTKRRFWILKEKNVNIGVLFRRYKIFCINPIKVSISISEPQLRCCWQNITDEIMVCTVFVHKTPQHCLRTRMTQ